MKYFLANFVVISVCSAVVEDPTSFSESDRYFYFPGDGDGLIHLEDSWQPLGGPLQSYQDRNTDVSDYWLYTRSNSRSPEKLVYKDPISVRNLFFNKTKETVFVVHGWMGNSSNEMSKMLTAAFLGEKDVNVIVVDWSRLARKAYIAAKVGAARVGRALGEFINWLTTFGVLYERVHLVGFSLGAHLVGNAGRATGSKVARITALDPAGPFWFYDSRRIQQSDAQYVEIIHTNAGIYGFDELCGDADFFPNGGTSMPGCLNSACSHSRSYEYMASSVRHNLLNANECANLELVKCDRCTGDINPMGNSDLRKSRRGIFRVNTATKIGSYLNRY